MSGAAFFDIDGTLLAKPSLERRFFWRLACAGNVSPANCVRWAAAALRNAPQGWRASVQGNKQYLRGARADIFSEQPALTPASWLPELRMRGLQQAWHHAVHGDAIVLVSGTLAPLAQIVKFALERELLGRGVGTRVAVLATRLEVGNARWTGRVRGEPMFGEAKAQAMRRFARQHNISLAQSSAYGDSSLDRWMLAAAGHPHAVNPDAGLRRIALQQGWKILDWDDHERTARQQRPLQWKREVAR